MDICVNAYVCVCPNVYRVMPLGDRVCVLKEGVGFREKVCVFVGRVCVQRVLRQTAESHLHLSVWVWIRSDPCAPQTEACNETELHALKSHPASYGPPASPSPLLPLCIHPLSFLVSLLPLFYTSAVTN